MNSWPNCTLAQSGWMPSTRLSSALTFTFPNSPSLGRLGLFVHITAGFGDVNFKGHWTLELACIQPVKIYPGMKIAQICYHDISEMPYTDYASKADAKYSNQGSEPVASKNYLNK